MRAFYLAGPEKKILLRMAYRCLAALAGPTQRIFQTPSKNFVAESAYARFSFHSMRNI